MALATLSTPLETICVRCGKQLGEHLVHTRGDGKHVELVGTDFCAPRGADRFESTD